MKLRFLIAAAAGVAELGPTANAQSSSARLTGDITVVLTARMTGPDGCTSLGNIGPGRPRGNFPESTGTANILVFVTRPTGRVCIQSAPLLKKRAKLSLPGSVKRLQVFFMDAADRVYKTETVVIR
jgi:hypothetical protein